MKLYCNKCYAKTEYKFSKPKFCPECGEKISNSVTSISFKHKDSKKEEVLPSNKNLHTNEEDFDEDDELEDDYVATKMHIENFKRNSKKSGIIVEKTNFGGGISFGALMEKVSSEPNSIKDFQGLDRLDTKKTKEQILEELRLESSSQARVVEIE
jgi:hypothetical protein